jgi:hypothetical protein
VSSDAVPNPASAAQFFEIGKAFLGLRIDRSETDSLSPARLEAARSGDREGEVNRYSAGMV